MKPKKLEIDFEELLGKEANDIIRQSLTNLKNSESKKHEIKKETKISALNGSRINNDSSNNSMIVLDNR